MSDQVSDHVSEAQLNAGPQGAQAQGGGGYPAGYGNPSVAGTQAPVYASPSQVPQQHQQQRRGGIVNKFKLPQVGVKDVTGNRQLLKQLTAEFLGTFLLVFFGIGSVITAIGGGGTVYYLEQDPKLKHYAFASPCEIQNFPIPKPGVPPPPSFELKPGLFRGDGCDPTSVDSEKLNDVLKFAEKYKIKHVSTYVVVGHGSGVTPLHVSFAFGIAVACIAQALGHVSGAHLNPAVSFGLVAAGECSIVKAVVYSVIQIIGALCGAGLLKILTWNYIVSTTARTKAFEEEPKAEFDPSKHTVGWSLGTSELGTAGYVDGIAIECFLTFILVLTVCGACDSLRKDVKGSAPLAIGFAVFLCHVVGISYTGSSVNPARSIGPVFYTMNCVKYGLRHLVVYIVGPILGGILAGVLYNIFFRAPPSEEDNPQASPQGYKKIA